MEFVDGLNLYRYSRCNPILLSDPRGTAPPEIDPYQTIGITSDSIRKAPDNISDSSEIDEFAKKFPDYEIVLPEKIEVLYDEILGITLTAPPPPKIEYKEPWWMKVNPITALQIALNDPDNGLPPFGAILEMLLSAWGSGEMSAANMVSKAVRAEARSLVTNEARSLVTNEISSGVNEVAIKGSDLITRITPGGGGGGGQPATWQSIASVLEDIVVDAESQLVKSARMHTIRIESNTVRVGESRYLAPSRNRMRHAIQRVWDLRDEGMISGSRLDDARALVRQLWVLVGRNFPKR